MATERHRLIKRAVTALIPRAPFLDAEAIRQASRAQHMRGLKPEVAVWLATIAHIRHQHTDYDELMNDGYEKDAARFFVLDDTNDILDDWGASRRLDPDADEEKRPEDPVDGGEPAEADEIVDWQ
ncbi:hypothetical protein FP2506_03014 [Fulvimarina pelagi HTCC2506]|uniref:DUF2293 domain-containing protein n=2 Tax=Fulvimarina pelagi TaxID=217511 RepID=Q0G0D0_9HYPH|nr:DUF2293 domain-containing protein [Fulvimarina pelagi]EAU40663.1 hypothetical protein FP2506_03014 [Fulvimarina pelagi HTCC2506]BAT31207.1 hypothetical protein [Fulvimarina pelagi]